MKQQLLEEVIVLLDNDFCLTSHCISAALENHLVSNSECSLVLGEHSARWFLLDLLQNCFNVRYSAGLLHRWSDEALKLITVHNGLNRGELKVELFDEVTSFDDESNVLVAQNLLCRQARNVDPWPVRSNHLTQEVKLIVAPVSLERSLLVLAHNFVDDVSTVE